MLTLIFKSRIDPYVRGGKIVRGYTNRKVKHAAPDTRQRAFIFDLKPGAVNEPAEVKKFYVTVIRNPGKGQRVGFLAGPFDTHEEALAHEPRARSAAQDVDPATAFDYFGTSGLTLPPGKHPPGKLNAHLGIASPA